jgi:lipid A 3-O-deacylase
MLIKCKLGAQVNSSHGYTRGYYAVNYSNDFFVYSDRYFTQGVRHDLVLASMAKWKITGLLIGSKGKGEKTYGLSLDQDCFTPRTILSPVILRGERPYAGTNFISFFLVENKAEAQVRLTSKIDAGVTGPCVLCEQEQKLIHKSLHQNLPVGWENQVGNGPVINYTIQVEKGLASMPCINFNAIGTARIGTLYTDASLGFRCRFGKMNNYYATFIPFNGIRKFQCYVFAKGMAKYVVYNATLQGRLFASEIYALPSAQLTRVVLHYEQGIAIQYKKIAMEFSIATLSPEFEKGLYHGWGNCRLYVGF